MTQESFSGQSIVRDLNFWTKAICFLFVLPLAAFLSTPKGVLVLVLTFFSILKLSRVGLRRFWSLSRDYVLALSFGIILLSLFFSLGRVEERIISGLILCARFAILISSGIFFSEVTNPIEIPAGFLQARIPHRFGVTLMVGYRMMPLLSKKIQTIMDAQRARGARIGFSLKQLDVLPLTLFSLAIPILHSTLEMSVHLSDALISRGYDPEGKITLPPTKMKKADFLLITIFIAFLLLLPRV